MGVLSHKEIKRLLRNKSLVIRPEPKEREEIQPASVDIHLGTELLALKELRVPFIYLAEFRLEEWKEKLYDKVRIKAGEGFILHTQGFVIAESKEYLMLPRNIVGRLDGRSSLGRLGLVVHATAGEIDPGFKGRLAFELSNLGKVPLKLNPGLKIGRLTFFKVDGKVEYIYGDLAEHKYQNQRSIEGSKLEKDSKDRTFIRKAKEKIASIENKQKELKKLFELSSES